MKRRNLIRNILIFIFAFVFGYTVKKDGEGMVLERFDSTINRDKFLNTVTDKIKLLNEQVSDKAKVINVTSHPLFNEKDISIALNDIISTCSSNSYIYLESGSYKSKRVNIMVNKAMTINLKGNIELISDTSLFRVKNNLSLKLDVDFMSTSVAGSICLEIYESYHGDFNLVRIQGFDLGIALVPNKVTFGYNEGVQYCKFNFDYMNCKNGGIIFQTGNNSLPWVNENTFTGGRVLGSFGIKTLKGTTQIDPYNNNKFYNIGCEGISGNAIDLAFANNNTFENFRFEDVNGYYIQESSECIFNRFTMSIAIKANKLNTNGRESFYEFPITSKGGTQQAYKRITNNHKNSQDFNLSLYDMNVGVGLSHGENNKNPFFHRYAMILREGKDIMNIPSRELYTAYIDNNPIFKMKYLYKDLRVLSNLNKVTIIIPNKFKYDGAEFHFSTNWNENPIVFEDENGIEQFRISDSDGIGTWEAMYVARRGSFTKFKVTKDYRAF
ncbi:hypothetical protein ACIQW7_10440 [Peribacillus simplex]|uniref:hypothetical protein n=1 Tax=Peribacillus simplex TaxID=1478 RepID=UPI003821ED5D